ncbi:hypothetical protein BCR43DRAFT_498828 [Syncephalastrum racemosum]|uniref:Myb-like domain-containing protein n=1 Tax=Syncephalastrum racemosum TaxID=13706 RepID=A0A1X2H1J1_SYNRA|nr:hypothetical protein BCR43DRAFT_498828 [Syncephalastrum racemosum]
MQQQENDKQQQQEAHGLPPITPGRNHSPPIFTAQHQQSNLAHVPDNDAASKQRALYEFMQREQAAKSQIIRAAYDYLTQEEISIMLMDCAFNENEVLHRLEERSDYLDGIRHIISVAKPTLFIPPPPPSPVSQSLAIQSSYPPSSPIPTHAHSQSPGHNAQAQRKLLQEDQRSLKRDRKKRTRRPGRLALDDALKQMQTQPGSAFEGWSEARIRAYQMIEQNPNSYYYRFNAPGEEQRKGPWSDQERELFFKRLQDFGANGQWGIFSMAIPGRVGYQCSNYYRLLIESKQIQDPNYVLDEKGKAHYLFDKKSAGGNIEKAIRTHSPHTFNKAKKERSRRKTDEDDDGSGAFTPYPKATSQRQRVTRSMARS